mgnify:CR=1 FL=1
MSIGKNILRLTAGSSVAQVVQLLSLPLLTRLYLPEAFGIYTLFLGLIAVASVFSSLKYDTAVVLPPRDAMAESLCGIVAVLSVATFGVALFAVALMLIALPADGERLLWIVFGVGAAVSLLIGGAQQIILAWLNRVRRYGLMGLYRLMFVLATVGCQVALVQFGYGGAEALIAGYVIGVGFVVVCFSVPTYDLWPRIVRIVGRPRYLKLAACRYSRFPRFMIPYGLSSTLRERLVHFFIGTLCGVADLGRFAMAARLVSAPNNFLYMGISPVMYAHAAQEARERVAQDGADLVELAVMLLAMPFVFLIVEAPAFIDILMGDEWHGLGVFVSILSVPYLILACTSWLDRLFDAYQIQRLALRLDVGFTIGLVVLTAAAAAIGDALLAAVVFAIVFSLYEAFWTWITYRASGFALAVLRRPLAIAGAVGGGSAALFVSLGALDSLATRCAIGLAAYLALVGTYLAVAGGILKLRGIFARPLRE